MTWNQLSLQTDDNDDSNNDDNEENDNDNKQKDNDNKDNWQRQQGQEQTDNIIGPQHIWILSKINCQLLLFYFQERKTQFYFEILKYLHYKIIFICQ
jgi:hypothetical protein